MLFMHLARAAAARTFCTAGNSKPIKIPMMAMTTRSSIRVKPADLRVVAMISMLPEEESDEEIERAQNGWRLSVIVTWLICESIKMRKIRPGGPLLANRRE